MSIGALRTPLAVFVELLWAFAAVAIFVQVFAQGDGPSPSLAAVSAVVAGSFALSRLLQTADLDETALRVTGMAVSLLTLILAGQVEYAGARFWDAGWIVRLFTDPSDAIRPNAHVLAGMIALVPLWLRGVQRGQLSEIDFDGVLASASAGWLIVVVAALSDPPSREGVPWGAFAFGYSVVALVALSVVHAPEPQANVLAFAARWAAGVAALATAAVAVALTAAAIDPGAFGSFAPAGEPLRAAGRALGEFVLGPILAVLVLPFRVVYLLLDWLVSDNPQREQPEPAEFERREPEDRNQPAWFRVLLFIAGGFGLGLVAVTALAMLWFAFRRFARRGRRDARERREDAEPVSSLAGDLAALFGALGSRLRRRPLSARSALAIRRLYFDVLRAAEERGLERPQSATPTRFAPQLDAYFGSDIPSAISAAFVESRYGERPLDEARVSALIVRWRECLPAP